MAILHLHKKENKKNDSPMSISEYIASLKDEEAYLTDKTTNAPKVLWHGSANRFNEFDMSKAGENTGLTEYTLKKTGEKVTSDSSKAMFFTDNREAAISYAFLARTNMLTEVRQYLTDIMVFLKNNGDAPEYMIQRIHNQKELHEAFRKLREEKDTYINEVLDTIDLSRKNPITTLDNKVKLKLIQSLDSLIKRYKEYEWMNIRGGLSNQLNNFTRMKKYLPYFEVNIKRLRENDPTVMTEHGKDFTEYIQTFYSKDGNYLFSARYNEDEARMYLNNEPMDTMSEARLNELLIEIKNNLNACIERFNKDIEKAGYIEHTFLYPVLLKSSNPFIHDYKGSAFPDKYIPNEKYSTAYIAARQVAHAVESGHDCVIYENIRDPFEQTNYGVFKTEQILIIPQNVTGLKRTPVLESVKLPETKRNESKEQTTNLSKKPIQSNDKKQRKSHGL